ncbi:MAG: VWA domain-containing protein [Rhizobiales bacterium]|nr:VWA domain-containing protein [Hyphomicrobiales bacterium]
MLPFAWAGQSSAHEGVETSAKIKPVVEVAFVLDTTGSMGPLIESAKRKIWSITTAIVDANPEADIRMGLVAYRDIGDDYITKTVNITNDIQDLYANLLELKARGGGDWPESVNEALHVGVTKLAWTQGPEICRIMFLVGATPRATATEMAGYMARNTAKNSGEAITGAGDLVADVKAGRQKLATVKDDDLPETVRNMKAAERQDFIDKQLASRKALNERMAALVQQRDRYVLEQAKKGPTRTADSFDRAVEETLRAQIKR